MPTTDQASVTQALSDMKVGRQEIEQEGHPSFLFNCRPEFLQQPGVYVGISMVSHSPLLEPAGVRQLVDYLASLPHPSVVLLADALNHHNVMAMGRSGKRSGVSEEKALRIALECGDMYKEAITNAIQENKDVAGTDKITLLRWEDMIDEHKMNQEAIAHKHYKKSTRFQERVDEVALAFLYHRRPQCKHVSRRMPHMVNYLLGEMPLLMTGLLYKGQHYPTFLYPTSTESLAAVKACPRGKTMWTLVDDIHNDPAFAELKEELMAADDGVESRNGVAILPILRYPEEKQVVETEGCPVRNLIRKRSKGLVDHEADGV